MRPVTLWSLLLILFASGCTTIFRKPADKVVDTVWDYEWSEIDNREIEEAEVGRLLDQMIASNPDNWRLHALRASHYARIGDGRAVPEHEQARALVASAEPKKAADFPSSPTLRTWFPGYDLEELDGPFEYSGEAFEGGYRPIVDWEMSPAVAQGRSFDADLARCREYAAQVPSPDAAALSTAIVAGALGAAAGAAIGAPFGAAGTGAQVGAASWGIQGAAAGGAAAGGRRNSIVANCLRNRGWALL